MSTSLILVAAYLIGHAPAASDAAGILNIGDPAPAMSVSRWVKGETFDRFEPGRTYVVEFWATWRSPCKTSIPHLTKLAHRYKGKGVRFVGVDVLEGDTKGVEPFVAAMGDKMDYSVALDTVADPEAPAEGSMYRDWMAAAVEDGIPAAFVVHDGKIAWIGHPMELDDPLAAIVAGRWNSTPLIATRLAEKIRGRKANEIRSKVFPIYNRADYPATIRALDEATGGDPGLAAEFEWLRFAALCNGADVEAGLALGAKLLAVHYDKPANLNIYFWNVVTPTLEGEPDPRVSQLALRAARRAVELDKGENLGWLGTLAEALYRTGDFDGAVAAQEKAIERLRILFKVPAPSSLKHYTDRLERFRKAASEKAKRP